MRINEFLERYKKLGEYFNPDYEMPNDILNDFKATYPAIEEHLAFELNQILSEGEVGPSQFFVADLLYLYESFPKILLEPLINCAIIYRDPSFNRIFIRPCIRSFGIREVAEILERKFSGEEIITKIGISMLLYWIQYDTFEDVSSLHKAIIEQGNKSSNLVEIYYYRLVFGDKIHPTRRVPSDAAELIAAVGKDQKYVNLLTQLGWKTAE